MTIAISELNQQKTYKPPPIRKASEVDSTIDELNKPRASGDPRFRAVLDELWEMHCRKGADYGTDSDQFANVNSASEFGVEPWRAALLKCNDKMTRLKAYCRRGTLANEGVEDSLLDAANYFAIAAVLFREQNLGH